jgi:hypothetical protein
VTTETTAPTLAELLEKYTKTQHELDAFREEHNPILVYLAQLQMELRLTEDRLKATAREQGPIENDHFAVTVTTKRRTWYDTDYILEHAPYVREIPGVVVQTIDKARIEALAKAKAIDADVCDAARREEALTPAVTIKAKVQPCT